MSTTTEQRVTEVGDGTVIANAVAVAAAVKKSVLLKQTGAKSVYVPRWLVRDLLDSVEQTYPDALQRMRTVLHTDEQEG